MAPSPKIRIKDIARLANVSTGTVDRVIHGRGEVSEDNRSKINKIIRELNYQPNLLARSLAKKQSFHLAAVLPAFQKGEYWERPCSGMDKAMNELSIFNISLDRFFFNQYEPASFHKAVRAALAARPDGVVMAPMFPPAATLFSTKLADLHIPYVYIDSELSGGGHLAYFGQHSFQSGYAAARLVTDGLEDGASVLVFYSFLPQEETNQFRQRKEGFRSFFTEEDRKDRYRFVDVSVPPDAFAKVDEYFANVFARDPDIRGAVVFNSRVFHLSRFLEKTGRKNVRVVGYDLIPENIEALRHGTISYLIAQRPEEQGYQAIQALYAHLANAREMEQTQYMPIDLLNRDNIEFYLDSLKR